MILYTIVGGSRTSVFARTPSPSHTPTVQQSPAMQTQHAGGKSRLSSGALCGTSLSYLSYMR